MTIDLVTDWDYLERHGRAAPGNQKAIQRR